MPQYRIHAAPGVGGLPALATVSLMNKHHTSENATQALAMWIIRKQGFPPHS